MPAFLVIAGTIQNAGAWTAYRKAVVPLIESFGGKHLNAAGKPELLEGADAEWTIALFEFETLEGLHVFWNSPEYQPVKALREGAATLDVWAVLGA